MKVFDQLNPTERIKAILAITEVPIDKHVAVELAGVDLFALDEQQRTEIEWAFSGSKVKGSQFLYRMGIEQRQRTFQELNIDIEYVYERIIDVLWPRLCNEISSHIYKGSEKRG